jgi:hypothetical protein
MDAAARNDDPADLYLRPDAAQRYRRRLVGRNRHRAPAWKAILVAAKTITNADGGTLYR